VPEPLDGERGDRAAVVIVQSDCAADSRVQASEHVDAHAFHASNQVCLDETVSRIPAGLGQLRADIERGMQPSRL